MKFFSFSSYPKLSNLKVLSVEALLLALYTILGLITIQLSPTLRISFSFLAMSLSCYYFGFWPNVVFAIAADFLGWLVRPSGAYMPFFALVAIVNATIYSFFFYRRESVGWKDVIVAKSIQMVVSNLFLNPLILQLMYDTPFWALFLSRVWKNLLELPLDVILLYFVLKEGKRLLGRISWLKRIKNKAVENQKF